MRYLVAAPLACFLALAAPARADDAPKPAYVTLELQTVFTDGETVPDLNGTTLTFPWGPLGVYGFFYVDRDYADALVGPAFSPAPWLTLAAGAGIEQAEDGAWRIGGMIWAGKPFRYTTVTFLETGASGFWGRTELTWYPARWAGVGVLGDLLLGVGPRVEFNVPGVPAKLWGASLYDWSADRPTGAIGLRIDL